MPDSSTTPAFPFRFYDKERVTWMQRRNLPHWDQPCTCAFVTFRLQDSMPQSAYVEWWQEKQEWLHRRGWPADLSAEEVEEALPDRVRRAYHRYSSSRFEARMDLGLGSCLLREPDTRSVLEGVLTEGEGTYYQLADYVIMPNHVHVLIQPTESFQLMQVLRSIRKQSAREINRRLDRTGQLWDDEPFDHLVRTMHHFDRYGMYIQKNPVRARLREDEYSLRVWEA